MGKVMNKIKHTNQMTMKELVEEAEELAKFEAHVSDLASLRLQNLRNEIKYRLSIEEQ